MTGPATSSPPRRRHFRAERFDYTSFCFTGLTGLATLFTRWRDALLRFDTKT